MKSLRSTMSRYVSSMQLVAARNLYVPAGLMVCLFLGSAALLTFFIVAPTQYNNLAPLFVSSAPGAGDKKGTTSRLIAVRAVGLEKNGEVQQQVDLRRMIVIRERVAMNILARSGYLKAAEAQIEQGPPTETRYKIDLYPETASCVSLAMDEKNPVEKNSDDFRNTAEKMALAAGAIEKFHRGTLHRSFEWAFARSYKAITGNIPNLSLGPAQIRMSTIRHVRSETTSSVGPYAVLFKSETQLEQMLSDECASLRIAATLLYYSLNKVHNSHSCDQSDNPPSCEQETAAAAYAGQRRHSSAVIDYGPILSTMTSMIENF